MLKGICCSSEVNGEMEIDADNKHNYKDSCWKDPDLYEKSGILRAVLCM